MPTNLQVLLLPSLGPSSSSHSPLHPRCRSSCLLHLLVNRCLLLLPFHLPPVSHFCRAPNVPQPGFRRVHPFRIGLPTTESGCYEVCCCHVSLFGADSAGQIRLGEPPPVHAKRKQVQGRGSGGGGMRERMQDAHQCGLGCGFRFGMLA